MRRLSLAAAVAAMALLCGCVSLFPKEAPAQLYRFGLTTPLTANTPASSRFAVQALIIDFNRAAAGDLILTVTGNQAAYIKGARWVSGASTLFEQALASAFDADQGAARLMARGEAVRPDAFLKLDVRVFEARYLQGPGGSPTVVVQVYAALSQPADRALMGERIFTASVPASDNRVGAIAQAFDQAVAQVLGQLVKWVDAKGAG
ncbi:MAG TPA: ABC-type transport auxiliary lipoprotein family protein [Caulobacteraceae bacterium]|jgi:cholesterol transport system auxiliary component